MNHNNPKSLRVDYPLASKCLHIPAAEIVMHSILSGAIFK